MGLTVRSFGQLKEAFDATVSQLLKKHGIDDKDEKKLSEVRQGQVKFLRAAITQLEKSPMKAENKAHILTGLMLVIREVIEKSYTKLSPEKSGLYRLLPEAMGVSKENQLTAIDSANLAEKARKFITNNVFSRLGEMKTNHIFSDINGFGFATDKGIESLEEVWKTANELAFKSENDNFDQAAKQAWQSYNDAMPKAPGFISKFFGQSGKPNAAAADEDQQLAPKP